MSDNYSIADLYWQSICVLCHSFLSYSFIIWKSYSLISCRIRSLALRSLI